MLVAITPDLECSITASLNEDGTNPIPDGGLASLGGGSPSIWLHYSVKNTGLKGAKNFQVTMVAANHGFLVHNDTQTLSLGGGGRVTFPKTFSAEINHLPAVTNEIQAFVVVDALDTVPEKSELNNFCSFKCTVAIVH